MQLLTASNPKTNKGAALGYLTAVLHLAPASLSGRNVCPDSTVACRAGCLNLAGRGGVMKAGARTNPIQDARIRRTRAMVDDRPAFMAQLVREVAAHVRRAERAGLVPAVRLNGTSDLPWERLAPDLFRPGVRFYDYTKSADRMRRMLEDPRWPPNYDLTYSWSGANGPACHTVLKRGGRVAVPFAPGVPVGDRLVIPGSVVPGGRPAVVRSDAVGWPIIDGDVSDLRFLEPGGIVVGLRAKGPAKRDASGWVVQS